MNPLADFLSITDGLDKQATEDMGAKRQRELEMWQHWQDNGKQPEHLKPLLQSIRPVINRQANIYSRLRDIPPAAIRAEFTNQAVQAFETYDPDRGTALATHVTNHLKKARRFVTTYQNPARIPETRIYRIRELQDATAHLEDRYGRSPTQLELSDHLKWSPRQVDVLQREVRISHPAGHFESDPFAVSPSRHQEIMRLLPYELNPEERQVFEYLHGVGGKPRLEPGQIAQKLNMSAPKVSRLKKSIADKYAKYGE